jgi:hypothetical protein
VILAAITLLEWFMLYMLTQRSRTVLGPADARSWKSYMLMLLFLFQCFLHTFHHGRNKRNVWVAAFHHALLQFLPMLYHIVVRCLCSHFVPHGVLTIHRTPLQPILKLGNIIHITAIHAPTFHFDVDRKPPKNLMHYSRQSLMLCQSLYGGSCSQFRVIAFLVFSSFF